MKVSDVIVAGKALSLSQFEDSELKSIPIDTKLKFLFYRAAFNDKAFCLLSAKKEENHASMDCSRLANRLKSILRLPIVFLFDNLQFVERNRLIERGVYFIVSNKFAFLPFLIINTRDSNRQKTEELSASAQYILLYHLQIDDLNGWSMADIETKMPFSYVTISRAFKNFEDLQLCKIEMDENRVKHIQFDGSKKEVWERTLPFLKSPVKKKIYCDGVTTKQQLTYGGISAMAHYTALNPDEVTTYVVNAKDYNRLADRSAFVNANDVEGDICIEIWNYPPLYQYYADQLSLYLTLRDDRDPRIEKELESMISKLW